MESEVVAIPGVHEGLPQGWRWLPLAEVADNLDNKRKPINAAERETRKGDVPYYGATGQVGWIDKHLLDEEVVLVGEDGAPFLEPGRPKAYMISGKSWVNNHAHILRARDGMPNAYLMHFLNILDYSPYVTGTTRLKLTKGAMNKIPVPVAPLPQQRRIVEAIELQLGRLVAAVARLQGAKARLKRYKQAVLKAAVEGSYCETPLEEWTENVLGDIATTIRNGYSKKPNAEEGIRIFRISAVRPLDLFVDDVRYLEAGTKDHEASMVTPGDVLFTRYNGSRDMVGACALVPNDCPPTVHPDKLIRVRVPSDELLPGMLAILGTVGEGRAYIESKIRTTAGQSGISGGDLKSLPLRYPPVEDQKRIIQDVEVRLNGMQELETTLDAQLQQAVRLRQAVLKRAFEGRLG